MEQLAKPSHHEVQSIADLKLSVVSHHLPQQIIQLAWNCGYSNFHHFMIASQLKVDFLQSVYNFMAAE